MLDRRPGRVTAGRLTAGVLAGVLLALALYASTFVVPYRDLFRAEDPLVRTDVARLAPARVERVEPVDAEQDLRLALSKRPYGVISNQPIRAGQLRGE
ncbi:MAG TPA: hypothetical protein VEK78_16360 [Gemmatimonadales bacterium]|nr:hypothetical protein [Gemmatimonadales bacterium]